MPGTVATSPINSEETYAVVKRDGSRVSPCFFHHELAELCSRVLTKQHGQFGLSVKRFPGRIKGSTLRAYLRELGWLDIAKTQQHNFLALCEEWSQSASALCSTKILSEELTKEQQHAHLEQVLDAAFSLDIDATRATCIEFLNRACSTLPLSDFYTTDTHSLSNESM